MRKRVVEETRRYLDDLARCVRECKRVDEAARFARWLLFSGILEIVRECAEVRTVADELYRLSETVIAECSELFKGGKANPNYAQSDIAEIHQKLDVLARFIDASPSNQNPSHKMRRHRGRRPTVGEAGLGVARSGSTRPASLSK